MMKIWLLGVSIYPISYVISVIIKLFGNKSYPFELPASFPLLFITVFLDSLLNRLEQFNIVISASLIIIILIGINAICFASIISILPKGWRPIALIILYILLVAINSYNIDINL